MDQKYYVMKQLFNIRIWSIDDVSLITGFSKGTIYNKTSRREIPFRKRGKRLFFISDEIINWIEEGEL
jgi:predicted DNA-binding transcriptional regulator AlpA